MRILALDTATENCSAALLIDGRLNARERLLERGHAEHILPMIDELLASAAVAISRFPIGSNFTKYRRFLASRIVNPGVTPSDFAPTTVHSAPSGAEVFPGPRTNCSVDIRR